MIRPIRLQPLFALALVFNLSACGDVEESRAAPQAQPRPIQVVRGAPEPAAAPAPVPKGSCWAVGMANVVGQAYTGPVAEQARQASGAQKLQILKNGEPSSGPPDGNRLTLNVNANETITDARCG